jgi:hypothetical protein
MECAGFRRLVIHVAVTSERHFHGHESVAKTPHGIRQPVTPYPESAAEQKTWPGPYSAAGQANEQLGRGCTRPPAKQTNN